MQRIKLRSVFNSFGLYFARWWVIIHDRLYVWRVYCNNYVISPRPMCIKNHTHWIAHHTLVYVQCMRFSSSDSNVLLLLIFFSYCSFVSHALRQFLLRSLDIHRTVRSVYRNLSLSLWICVALKHHSNYYSIVHTQNSRFIFEWNEAKNNTVRIDYFFTEIHQQSWLHTVCELNTFVYGYDYMALEKHWIRETAENPNKIISFAAYEYECAHVFALSLAPSISLSFAHKRFCWSCGMAYESYLLLLYFAVSMCVRVDVCESAYKI